MKCMTKASLLRNPQVSRNSKVIYQESELTKRKAHVKYEKQIHLKARQSLRNDNADECPIPVLYSAFQDTDTLYLVTTLAPCGSLWDTMSINSVAHESVMRPLSLPELHWWAPQMAAAIHWVHEKAFAHR
jgi:hypothetical protein